MSESMTLKPPCAIGDTDRAARLRNQISASGLASSNVEHLNLGEAEQAPGSVLDADSRPLRAAERKIRPHREMLVHPGRAALELAGNFGRALRILRPHRAAQPVMGGVRAP